MDKSMPENEERDHLLPKPQPTAPVLATSGFPPRQNMNRACWSAEGFPVQERSTWGSGIFCCLGSFDEFWSSDLEVCCLGSMFPCVLYGSNVERLRSGSQTFKKHFFTYTGLYFLGNVLFGWNCLAPCYAFQNRTAIRHTFILEGGCEACTRSCGCCGSMIEDDDRRETCESICDFTTHFFCHPCALCQEGRQLRRKLPHPGFTTQPILMTNPPTEQTMYRNA